MFVKPQLLRSVTYNKLQYAKEKLDEIKNYPKKVLIGVHYSESLNSHTKIFLKKYNEKFDYIQENIIIYGNGQTTKKIKIQFF